MLVVSLRGRGRPGNAISRRVRAAQHVLVRRAGVEPDVERVACSSRTAPRRRPSSSLGVELLPGLDAALLDALRHRSSSSSVRGCSSPVSLCEEERHRHAPLPLARQRPVGPVGDHAVQARLAPARDRTASPRCRAAPSRAAARRLRAVVSGHVVHAGEPLRRRAVDHRRLVAPAVHVAVRDRLGVQQRAGVAQRVDDLRIRLPDRQAAEERQRRRVARRRPAPGSGSRRRFMP